MPTAADIASQSRGADHVRLMLVASGAVGLVFGTLALVSLARAVRVLVNLGLAPYKLAHGLDVTGAHRRTSTRSGDNGGNCVEVADNLPA